MGEYTILRSFFQHSPLPLDGVIIFVVHGTDVASPLTKGCLLLTTLTDHFAGRILERQALGHHGIGDLED